MAKTGFFLVFALVLLLSIHLASGTLEQQPKAMGDGLLEAGSNFKEAMASMSNTAGDKLDYAKEAMASMSNAAGDKMEDAKEVAKEKASSWTGWFKNIFGGKGLFSGKHKPAEAAAGPVPAPAPAPISSSLRGIRVFG